MGEEEEPKDNEKEEIVSPDEKPKRRRKRKRKTATVDTEKEETNSTTVEESLVAADRKKHEQLERTVYIEGIPYDATSQNVRDFFTDNGIENDAIVDLRLPVWHDSNRLRGYGHVVLNGNEAYKKAIALSGKYLLKRYLTIEAANAPKRFEAGPSPDAQPSKTVMLNNLAYAANEEEIISVVERYGTLVSGGVRVVRHHQSQLSKGFAYCEFEDISSAQQLVQDAANITILGRACRVDYDHGRMKGSFRGSSGRLWRKEQ